MRVDDLTVGKFILPLSDSAPSFLKGVRQGLVLRVSSVKPKAMLKHGGKKHGLEINGRDELGSLGTGECSPLPGWSKETLGSSLKALAGLAKKVIGEWPDHPDEIIERTAVLAGRGFPALTFGLQTALLGLAGLNSGSKAENNAGVGFTSNAKSIDLNAIVTITSEDPKTVAIRINKAGYRCVKIKAGRLPPKLEIYFIRRLAAKLDQGTLFRIDANGVWSPRQAESFAAALKSVKLEYLEDPLRPGSSVSTYRSLFEVCGVPMALDHQGNRMSVNDLLEYHWLKALVLKPTLRESLSVWSEAVRRSSSIYKSGKEVVVSSSYESPFGLNILAYLASRLPSTYHGLATASAFLSSYEAASTVKGRMKIGNQLDGLGTIIPIDL